MKRQWKTILADAMSTTIGKEIIAGVKAHEEESDSFAGDEREEGDVVAKIKERKYRVGETFSSFAPYSEI